jgi:hypothetical protein
MEYAIDNQKVISQIIQMLRQQFRVSGIQEQGLAKTEPSE